ncbi:hypothetical protein F511_47087 [Dorcoceras hygrometricum]|uniref:Uncharacterized protein n=1 Tax=Dorcoceras hygrometricum TaxID=472368 RepID=A0A2Z6ZSG7_9LAMI|nr:hypothetical protein F511_47087 [Dorcoceras hygrometricum]
MPPRRGRSRRSAEGSRAPDSDEDVHRVDDVTRRIGEMELVLASPDGGVVRYLGVRSGKEIEVSSAAVSG